LSYVYFFFFFFFSSRRRHTRLQGDWSSDVCSSDLDEHARQERAHHRPNAEATDLEATNEEAQRQREKDRQLGVVPQGIHEPVHGSPFLVAPEVSYSFFAPLEASKASR